MMDYTLGLWTSGLIELSKLGWMLGANTSWTSDRKLRFLFAGYNGARNTGADVRVEEMLRQIRRVLGANNVDLSVLTQDKNLTAGYFKGTHQVRFPDVFPPFLFRELRNHDGVVTCEGSMFKSKFANALSIMMIGSLGLASARNGLSVGYGAEAGHMDAYLRRMCRRYCKQSLVITRNTESSDILQDLGISTDVGTDTAWTFEPHPAEYGEKVLRSAGWDGKTPILIVCPINPFWWPVRASILKWIARFTTGAFKSSHYRSMYFHNAGPDVDAAYARYIKALAGAIKTFKQGVPVFPVMVAMERLDTDACHKVAAELGGAPVMTSADYDMYQLVSIARCGTYMVSSRYHGIVTTMPAGVVSAGVTMDERIRNLMHDRGQKELFLTVNDPDLEPKLLEVLKLLSRKEEKIRDGINQCVAKNIKVMARMGVRFEDHVRRRFPEFPLTGGVRRWDAYLPEMSQPLLRLMDNYG
jgi:polysaccharide pyruvyl transferase WcaK-like protein